MKNKINVLLILGFIICIVFIMGCDNLAGHNGNLQNNNTSLSNIRSVNNDPINNCLNENVH
jgi:hypothetical protein